MENEIKIKNRDVLARICEYKIKNKKIEFPTFFPVINPNLLVIEPKEIEKEFKHNAIITNAYILYKSKFKNEILEKGLEKFFDFSGIIMLDSGAYQIYQYKEIEVSNKEIIEFEKKLNADIATFLDIPMSDKISYKKAFEFVKVTIERAKECKELTKNSQTAWLATVQGSIYNDLVKYCAKEISKLNFDFYAIGSIKIALEQWDYKKQIDLIIQSKKYLPWNKPLHFWGAGHPASFSLLVLLGIDSFDSASYAQYAYDNRYMTLSGTLNLESLEYLPCNCPICSKYDVKDLKESEEKVKLLAKHNLYLILSEIKTIKQAIIENWLIDLVQQRVRAHHKLYESFVYLLKKYGKFLEKYDLISKKSGFVFLGEESRYRPEIIRAKKFLKRVKSKEKIKVNKLEVPTELQYVYPFNSLIEDKEKKKIKWEKAIKKIIDYWYGKNASKYLKNIKIEFRKSGLPGKVYMNEKLIGIIRDYDSYFIPTFEGAEIIKKALKFPKNRIVVKEEAIPFVSKGRSLFVKFIEEFDNELKPYQEVFLVDKNDNLIATGKLLLNIKELKDFRHHVAVKVRHFKGG